MIEAIEQADDWLNISRLELDVYTDNKNAIKLYQQLGFEIEGTKRKCSYKNGAYADLLLMARLNFKLTQGM